MKNLINYLASLVYPRVKYALAVAVLLLVIAPISFGSETRTITYQAPRIDKAEVVRAHEGEPAMAQSFFGGSISGKVANSIVSEKEKFVSTRKAYPASLKVIQKHEKTILAKAEEYGVPADVAIGIGLLENGGSETAKSKAGALGVFQLMPSTARSLGLTVNKKVDERKDPAKNIDAGMRYLSRNYKRFGDWGLATWAYHAGEGNVSKAVKLYAEEEHNVKLVGLKNSGQMKKYIEKNNITVHGLLSNSAVQKFTKKLNDDSSGYPYKVLATAKLFKKAKNS